MAKPKLRFPEFADEWKMKRLGDVFTERNDLQKISDDAPLLSFTIEQGIINPEDKKTNKRDFLIKDKENKKFLLTEYNDIIYNPANIKFGAIHRNKLGRGVVSPIYAIFTTDENPIFMEYMVRNERFIKKSLKYLEGTVVKLMTLKPRDFLLMQISISSLEEQQKIADFLSKVDEKIANQETVVSDYEKMKKGLMQKIFNQEVRFKADDGSEYPEWEEKSIGNACIINPKTEELENEFYYIDLGSVDKGNLVLNSMTLKENAPSRAQRALSLDDVIFQSVRPYNMGHYHYTKLVDKQMVASTGFIQLRLKKGNNSFLYQLLYTYRFNNEVNIRCTGSNYPAINSDSLAEIKIGIPCLEEQQKIADCLSAMDRKIEAEKKILEDWKELKKALLQQMFV